MLRTASPGRAEAGKVHTSKRGRGRQKTAKLCTGAGFNTAQRHLIRRGFAVEADAEPLSGMCTAICGS